MTALNKTSIALYGGVVVFLLFALFQPLSASAEANKMAGIVLWMSVWWLTECVHPAVTSLLPIVLLPLCQIADIKDVSQQYGNSIIFLFLGGFLLSIAIEKWDLHKRIARGILQLTGHSVNGILAGIMLATFLMSNWISNTATALMLLGAILALLYETKTLLPAKDKENFSSALLLGMAYAASIGGMATPVGTPPNMYFFKIHSQLHPSLSLSFMQWIVYFVPLSLLILAGCFFILKILFLNKLSVRNIPTEKLELHRKFRVSYEEKVVLVVFLLTVILWLTREINIPAGHFKGWRYLFKQPSYVDDALVAIAAALVLFIIPSKKKKGEFILTWEDVKHLKYDILLIFGGGFALAHGFEKSGLIIYLVQQLTFVQHISVFWMLLFISLTVTVISEFASNIASVQLALPIIAALSKHFPQEMSLKLLFSCVLSASVGFILPVATAPNTIAFGTGRIPLSNMYKAGFWLDLFSIFTISIYCYCFL